MCVAARTYRSADCTLKGPADLGSRMKVFDVRRAESLTLVVEDVHEIGDGIERLLKADGYRVVLARDELEGIESAQLTRPDLILVNWTGLSGQVLPVVDRIRERSAIGDEIPVVFWIEDIDEGEEVEVAGNVFLTRPDSFNQLRGLLARLLDREVRRVHVSDELATE